MISIDIFELMIVLAFCKFKLGRIYIIIIITLYYLELNLHFQVTTQVLHEMHESHCFCLIHCISYLRISHIRSFFAFISRVKLRKKREIYVPKMYFNV